MTTTEVLAATVMAELWVRFEMFATVSNCQGPPIYLQQKIVFKTLCGICSVNHGCGWIFSPVDLAGELPAGVGPGELDGHSALGRAGPVLVRDLPLLRVRQLDGAVPPRYLQILARGWVNFLPQNRLDSLPPGLAILT